MATILVVEDEHLLGKSLSEGLTDDGHQAEWVTSAEQARDWLRRASAHVALLDIRLPGESGLDLLASITADHPQITCIVMTAHGSVPIAVEAMKRGAYDFLTKPVDLDAVSLLVRRALEHQGLTWQRERQRKEDHLRFSLANILGECPEIRQAKDRVRRLAALGDAIAQEPPNVLITGETGTGKDLFARAVHHEGPRANGPYVHVNCAALPETLIESELFGHVKGAFTDAKQSKRGLIEMADGGTLFLDEIGSLPLTLQAKLLVALETRRIRPVGSVQDTAVDVHLIAATNQHLPHEVREGGFREDLYHRLRVIELSLPPLRRRGEDLVQLTDAFLAAHARRFRLPPRSLTQAARSALKAYTWPGNVRELNHALESAVLLADSERIDRSDLPLPSSKEAAIHVGQGEGNPVSIDWSNGPLQFAEIEREVLKSALQQTSGNVVQAAALLGLSRDTMRYRTEKFGLSEK